MGITIYYKGKLHTMEKLPSLIEEVIFFCRQSHWEYELFHRSCEVPVQGIAFEPKGSHAVWMTFNDNGELITPPAYEEFGEDIDKNYQVNTKTHYAGYKNHIRVVELIRYLALEYFSEFSMLDESQFWQTRNKAICQKEFEIMEQWVGQMINRLDELDGRIGEIGDAGEIVDERIFCLLMNMPAEELAVLLDTPRPVTAMMGSLDN